MKLRKVESFHPPRSAPNYTAHTAALMWAEPGYESMIKCLANSIDGYVMEMNRGQDDGPLDGQISPAVGSLLQGFRGLLNGDIGHRLEAGRLDDWVVYVAAAVGFCLNHDEMAYDCGCGVDKIREAAGV